MVSGDCIKQFDLKEWLALTVHDGQLTWQTWVTEAIPDVEVTGWVSHMLCGDMLWNPSFIVMGLLHWSCSVPCILDVSVLQISQNFVDRPEVFLHSSFFSTLKVKNHFLNAKCHHMPLKIPVLWVWNNLVLFSVYVV